MRSKQPSFSSRTHLLLRWAGWRRSRHVSTERWSKLLCRMNDPVPEKIQDFLSAFGGLKVWHPHKYAAWTLDYFCIDPERADKYFCIREDGLSDYEVKTDTQLYGIGSACRDYALLMMDEQGCVYAAVDNLLFYIAPSGHEAIESMCGGEEWRLLHENRAS
jgi:hypothetical protein